MEGGGGAADEGRNEATGHADEEEAEGPVEDGGGRLSRSEGKLALGGVFFSLWRFVSYR